MSRYVKLAGQASGGGGYTHPACICQTVLCTPCYKTNFTSTIDGTACVKPTAGTDWVTIYSLCGTETDYTAGTCIALDFDYYNYDAICIDISVGVCCCCSPSQYVILGHSSGYNHCCCYPYHFEMPICGIGTICCHQHLFASCCQCGQINFSALFRPAHFCQWNQLANQGCPQGIVGYRHSRNMGGANFGAGGFTGEFYVCPYNQPTGQYCMWWCNWDRILMYHSCGFCQRGNTDRINITGRRYKSYDGS